MDFSLDAELGFAPWWDQPVRYIDRTQTWYEVLGYGNPYRWAQYVDVPFTRVTKPLKQSRVALITTAAPFRPELGPQDKDAPYNAAAKFYEIYTGDTSRDHDLRISHVGVHRGHLSNDSGCWFPLPALRRARDAGRIGSITSHFIGVPTNRSQRHTLDADCPEVLRLCREMGAEAAVLVPNCPVCHQTMGLTARHLEAAGLPTVVIGAAKDITERCGVPRFLFSDFPLGNAAGLPDDPASQDATLALALDVLESSVAPRTIVQNPLRWSGNPEWRLDYLNVERLTPAEIAERRAANDKIKEVAQGVRDTTLAKT